MTIPKYINCRNKEYEVCEYFMDRDCEESCAYARDIRGINQIGIGAITEGDLFKKLRKETKHE